MGSLLKTIFIVLAFIITQEALPTACRICLESIAPQTAIVSTCYHEFHIECLAAHFLLTHRLCPLCNQNLEASTAQLIETLAYQIIAVKYRSKLITSFFNWQIEEQHNQPSIVSRFNFWKSKKVSLDFLLIHDQEYLDLPYDEKILLQNYHESDYPTFSTFLHYAHDCACSEGMMHLIIKYSQPEMLNLKNHEGKTFLHIATEQNYFDICNHLLKKGASPNIQDNHKRDVFYYASNNKEIMALLKRKRTRIAI